MKDYNRISCPACNYPMRVLDYKNGVYQCYCAECQMDRYVKLRKRCVEKDCNDQGVRE